MRGRGSHSLPLKDISTRSRMAECRIVIAGMIIVLVVHSVDPPERGLVVDGLSDFNRGHCLFRRSLIGRSIKSHLGAVRVKPRSDGGRGNPAPTNVLLQRISIAFAVCSFDPSLSTRFILIRSIDCSTHLGRLIGCLPHCAPLECVA